MEMGGVERERKRDERETAFECCSVEYVQLGSNKHTQESDISINIT